MTAERSGSSRRFDAAASAFLFAALWGFGSSLGPTDDEAYYWVLAQRLAPGYAFHPPGVAWLIRLAQEVGSGLVGAPANSVACLRFFSSLLAAVSFFLLVDGWRDFARLSGGKAFAPGRRGTLLLLATFGGLWSASWMMVPDLPLLAGFSLVWWSCLRLLADDRSVRGAIALFAGSAVAMLGKYSGIFVLASACVALLWESGGPSARRRRAGLAALAVIAGGIGFLPGLWWNATHQWSGFLYHLSERHGGSGGGWHPVRWLQFLASQLVVVGPVLVAAATALLVQGLREALQQCRAALRSRARLDWSPAIFGAIFAAPPFFVYGLVPLRGDFKPHWMLIAWLPLLLVLIPGWASVRGGLRSAARVQAGWGLAIALLLGLSMQFPLAALGARVLGLPQPDPLLDVSNDLVGWELLRDWRNSLPEGERLPLAAARYQVAAQAAFALEAVENLTLLPRDLRQRDEWPSIALTDRESGEPLRILAPFHFIADGRYSRVPAFTGGECTLQRRLRASRAGVEGTKVIIVYSCRPSPAALPTDSR